MATSMRENSMAQECAVCVEKYREPRILECAHHFCKVCLEEIAERHPQGYTTCPICRHVTKTDGAKAVVALPKYRMLNYFIEEVKAFESEATASTKQCDICSDDLATKSCFQCLMNYCDKCIKNHEKIEKVAGHEVYPISKYMFCEQHDAHGVCICQECGVFCCPRCIMTTHMHHEMSDIHEMSKSVKERLFEHKCKLVSEHPDEMSYKNVKYILLQAQSVQSETSKEADALINSLKQLIRKVENLKSKADGKLSSTIRTLNMYAADMKDFLDSKSILIKMIDALSKQTSPFEMTVRESSLPDYHTESISNMLASPLIKISDIHSELKKLKEKIETYSKGLNYSTSKHELGRNRGKPIRIFERTASLNAGIHVWGITIDEKESTVVVRRNNAHSPITVYDNNGVKLKSLGMGLTDIYGTHHQGIAIDTKRNMYVLPVTKGRLVTLSKDGTVVSNISVMQGGKVLHGICYSHKDIYVTCSIGDYNGTNSIYLINPESKVVIKTIQNRKSPWGVTCDVYQGTPAIMVCGYGHTLKVMDYDGNELQTFGTGVAGSGVNQLYNPYGVTTDPAGRLLVCDQANNRVMSINHDSWEVLLDKSKLGYQPLHIAINLIKRILVVGNSNGSVTYFTF